MRRSARMTATRRAARGFTLIEVLIALTISIILLAGLIFTFITVRSTFSAQTGFAQLQDDQRIAVNMLSQTVQQAGYFPSPEKDTPEGQFPKNTVFTQQDGQTVTGSGTGATGSGADVLTVRFVASKKDISTPLTSDFILNCNGAANTSTTATATFVNQFTLNTSNELTCAVNGASAVALVGNVSSWSVLYGLDMNGDGTAFRYYTADAVTTANLWNRVISTRIALNFINPLANQPGQPATINLVRVVNLMNQS